jgi:amphi-Trp domain-containing protein
VTDKQAIQFDGNMDVDAAAAYLEGLAQGLHDRRILIESGAKSLTLDVASQVTLELEAASKPNKGKSSIEISLNWRVLRSAAARPSTPALLIGGGTKETQTDERWPPEFKAFNLSTRQQCTILNPEIVTMKNGRKLVRGLASDDGKTKVSRILGAEGAATADQIVRASVRSNGQEAPSAGRRSS